MVRVCFCLGLDCASRGGQELLAMVEADPQFRRHVEISFEKCMGHCHEGAEAPVVRIEGVAWPGMSAESLATKLHELIGEGE
jgi:NADH:ubiquinone oxidoreductase subunit E